MRYKGCMTPKRELISVDDRRRAYLGKLGFEKGSTPAADPVEGEELAWIIRPGRVITDVELAVLGDAANLESLIRAGQESKRDDDTIELA